MTLLQSFWLIYQLYFKKGLPDINKIQSFGLLAVKIGQIHALRLDFLSAEKCNQLSKLYRNNNPIPAEDVQALVKELGGDKFTSNFASFDTVPLATASVGQVYKATLLDGSQVVVKFIKSRFKQRFESDVKKIKKLFKLVLFFYPKLGKVGNPIGILEDVETYTLAELDLTNERKGALKLKELAEDFKKDFDFSTLAFLKYYPALSSENVLVSEFVPAPSVDELLAEGKFSYQDMLKLFFIQGFYIFKAGKFHGDIHPGNILYDGQKFYFVDTAYVAGVGERIRKGLFYFFDALSIYNYAECAKWLNYMADTRIQGERYEKFKQDFISLYKNYTDSTVSQVSLTRQMMLTIKLGVNSGMEFEKGIFPIIRSLMYLDGMVLKCNPNAILVKDMRPFIETFKKDI